MVRVVLDNHLPLSIVLVLDTAYLAMTIYVFTLKKKDVQHTRKRLQLFTERRGC